jgi:hypothetical protein
LRDLPVWVIEQRVAEHSRLDAVARDSGNRVRWTKAELERFAADYRSAGTNPRRTDPGHAMIIGLDALLEKLESEGNHTDDARLLFVPRLALHALWLNRQDGNHLSVVNAPHALDEWFPPGKSMNEMAFVHALASCRHEVRSLPPLQPPSLRSWLGGRTWLRRWIGQPAQASHSHHIGPRAPKQKPMAPRSPVLGWGILTLALVGAIVWFRDYVGHLPLPTAPQDKPPASMDLTVPWLIGEAGLLAFCVTAGLLARRRLDGVLIDGARNRLSLARLQWVMWFVLIFGAYFTEAAWNLGHGLPLPTASPDLWRLLAIVSGAPVVSAVVLNPKASTPATPTPAMVAAQSQGFALPAPQPPPGQDAQLGSLDRNLTSDEASWADLYLGEEVANRNDVDISRLQQLVATIALGVVFTGMLHSALAHVTASGASMPVPDANFQWLLGISSGAYLASKAVPKTPMQPPG